MRMTKELALDLLRDDSGQDLVEYVLIAILISVAAVVAMATLGETVNDSYEQAAQEVQNATSS